MLKREKAIQLLIANGYDDTLVTELPKLFVADYFEKVQEMISEQLDIFIDLVQRGDITPDENSRVKFAFVEKMNENDFSQTHCWGVYYGFKHHMTEEFIHIAKRRPLRNILLNSGILELDNGYQRFHKEIVGSPQENYDLCRISPYKSDAKPAYIKLNDLLAILLRKGIKKEAITVIYSTNDTDSIPSKETSDGNIYIDYGTIMALGDMPGYAFAKSKKE